MKEYYLLQCGCLMTCEKIKYDLYHYCVVLPRCVQSRKDKSDYTTDTPPAGYSAKLLTKLEATLEMLNG
jgi:hypothetical protein